MPWKSLAKDPERRFQTAIDLKRNLNWALEPQPGGIVIPQGSRWWRLAMVAALILGISAAFVLAHFHQPAASVEGALRLEISPPPGGRFVFGGNLSGIALSPDGKTAAFVANVNGTTALWVRQLDGTTARLLPGTEGANSAFWSPDSKTIAFSAVGKLQRAELTGGTPLTICDLRGLALGGAWGDDGYIVLGTSSGGLLRVPGTGGTPSPLTALDASRNEGGHRWPQVLPGGRFLYLIQSGKAEVAGIVRNPQQLDGRRCYACELRLQQREADRCGLLPQPLPPSVERHAPRDLARGSMPGSAGRSFPVVRFSGATTRASALLCSLLHYARPAAAPIVGFM
jgi:hypothetical protein